jgi:hypothetical protein
VTPDQINSVFEGLGAFLTLRNTLAVYRAKGYVGITLAAVVFFTSWGGWNCFFYPHLHQMWSFAAGVVMFAVNISWLSMMVYYGPVQRKDW